MESVVVNSSVYKTIKTFWLALLLIISVTFKWVWFMVVGINEQQTKKIEKFWDMLADGFDEQSKNEGISQVHVRALEKARKYLKPQDVVLDYGCATGAVALEFADTVHAIHGIDISSKMIAAANKKATEQNVKNVDFTHATIFDERWEKGSFDVILALGILHLVEDRDKVINRINELLKPAGLMISVTECMDEKKSWITVILSFLLKIGLLPSMGFFKISELEDSHKNGNFRILETEILAQNPVAYFVVAEK